MFYIRTWHGCCTHWNMADSPPRTKSMNLSRTVHFYVPRVRLIVLSKVSICYVNRCPITPFLRSWSRITASLTSWWCRPHRFFSSCPGRSNFDTTISSAILPVLFKSRSRSNSSGSLLAISKASAILVHSVSRFLLETLLLSELCHLTSLTMLGI